MSPVSHRSRSACALHALIGTLVAMLACAPAPAFRCEGDAACDLESGGTCERSSYCSYPDRGCASLRRYHEDAEEGRAGRCVGAHRDLIDDFEDGDLAILEVEGRNGSFIEYVDETGGTHTFEVAAPVPALPGSVRALHVAARGFTDWGAGVASMLIVDDGGQLPFDATAFTGLGFLARGTEAGMTFRLMLRTPLTGDPAVCTKCKDHFGTTVILGSDWEWYYVPFADLRQEGWGLPQGELDRTQVLGTDFKLLPGDAVEYWLDDLALVAE